MAGFRFDHETGFKQLSRKLDELTGISLKKPRSLPNPKGFYYIA
jgi:hypothetical protein